MVGGGLKLGFQVTEYDGGEGVPALGAGCMRAAEKRQMAASRETGVYSGWASPHFSKAFASRVARFWKRQLGVFSSNLATLAHSSTALWETCSTNGVELGDGRK
jgi:hypothetical protein